MNSIRHQNPKKPWKFDQRQADILSFFTVYSLARPIKQTEPCMQTDSKLVAVVVVVVVCRRCYSCFSSTSSFLFCFFYTGARYVDVRCIALESSFSSFFFFFFRLPLLLRLFLLSPAKKKSNEKQMKYHASVRLYSKQAFRLSQSVPVIFQ